ncbi:hypothetical protein PILCRDRAFT_540876 [Piloderma croceum F 1598]|uniref:Uncharacterized protein n=1 Tax=Piloderma croceum (strain F 1598) TaxID=765440 RepID=A0A0C3FK87_PILCF|nr:hypothetical protein PILCRDRAFT_734459 [Piloderma croceum F 1598]KIM79931.1 hypothetical protein PILCRDRAFT_540876 [Piloderma croceum F 1598]
MAITRRSLYFTSFAVSRRSIPASRDLLHLVQVLAPPLLAHMGPSYTVQQRCPRIIWQHLSLWTDRRIFSFPPCHYCFLEWTFATVSTLSLFDHRTWMALPIGVFSIPFAVLCLRL